MPLAPTRIANPSRVIRLSPLSGLVLFWTMQAFNVSPDLSPAGNDGTISGNLPDAPSAISGRSPAGGAGAREFAVNGGTITAILDYQYRRDFTCSVWFRWASFGIGEGAICGTVDSDPGQFYMSVPNRTLTVRPFDNAVYDSGVAPSTDVWHHAAYVHSSDGVLRIYLDNVQIGGNFTWTPADRFDIWIVQTDFADVGFDGAIDELRLYDRALSAGEISDIFNDHKIYPIPPPVRLLAPTR